MILKWMPDIPWENSSAVENPDWYFRRTHLEHRTKSREKGRNNVLDRLRSTDSKYETELIGKVMTEVLPNEARIDTVVTLDDPPAMIL
jgi:hypothetical protein